MGSSSWKQKTVGRKKNHTKKNEIANCKNISFSYMQYYYKTIFTIRPCYLRRTL